MANYCGANAFYTLFSWMPSYFSETYASSAHGWVFNVVPYVCISATSVCAPALASRMIARGRSVCDTRRTLECASLTGIAVCLFAVSRVESYAPALLLLSAAMACRGLHHGGASVIVQEIAPDHTGAVFGLMNMSSAIPGFVGVYVAGYLLQVGSCCHALIAVADVSQLAARVRRDGRAVSDRRRCVRRVRHGQAAHMNQLDPTL